MTPDELDAIEAALSNDSPYDRHEVVSTVPALIAALREAWAEVEQWRRMAERREEALDALGAERNTWARQMADLHDERDDDARAKADAEARMREALDERDDALDRAEKAEAEADRLRAEADRLRRGEEDGVFTSVVHECCERVEKAGAALARVRVLCDDAERVQRTTDAALVYTDKVRAAIDGGDDE